LTTPSVPYRMKLRNGQIKEVENALNVPEDGSVAHFEEPIAEAVIFTPKDFLSNVMNLC